MGVGDAFTNFALDTIRKKLKTQSVPLTYGDLEIGDKFISFPTDGDDSGHGGFRGGRNLFMKLSDTEAVNVGRDITSSFREHSQGMQVIKVYA